MTAGITPSDDGSQMTAVGESLMTRLSPVNPAFMEVPEKAPFLPEPDEKVNPVGEELPQILRHTEPED